KTCAAIENLDSEAIEYDDACGRNPVIGLLESARARHMRVTTLDLRNSGDTAGSKERVVGYGAWMFEET
ncbi:MAG: AmmeMemoRadiSam system protein B, partial [Gammaproteobacteria bacterium]